MRLFFAPDITTPFYTFNEQESKHIVRVLRFKEEDKLLLTDGKGYFYEAVVSEASPKRCTVKVLNKRQEEKHNYYLHIAIAPTKNIERFEWFLEKATEIGIDEITPILTKNSERKKIKKERLLKVVEAAMKQSHKAYHPKLNDLTSWVDFIKQDLSYDKKFIAHCYQQERESLKQALNPKESILIMIGPEGDFSLEEVQEASLQNLKPLQLGDYRLRTETAGITSAHAVAFINER